MRRLSRYLDNRFAADGLYHPVGDFTRLDANIGHHPAAEDDTLRRLGAEDLEGRALAGDLALIHHQHAVGQLHHLRRIVAHQEQR
jgi:hypothetical protein